MTHGLFTRDLSLHVPHEGTACFVENTVPWPLDAIIERVTGSPLAHVSVVLRNPDGILSVYEAVPPVVRKITYHDFITTVLPKWEAQRWTRRLGGLNTVWWEPGGWLEQWRLAEMRRTAEALLGTPYNMILNWWRNIDFALHCAEYAGLIYEAGEMMTCAGGREDPGSVFRKLLEWKKTRWRWKSRRESSTKSRRSPS